MRRIAILTGGLHTLRCSSGTVAPVGLPVGDAAGRRNQPSELKVKYPEGREDRPEWPTENASRADRQSNSQCGQQSPREDLIGMEDDLQLTPALLEFYRGRLRDLQEEACTSILARLKRVEMSAQERTTLERDVLQIEGELENAYQDINHLREALVRERRAVIELVQDNIELRGSNCIWGAS